MNRKNASVWWIAGSLLGVGTVALWAQVPPPAAVQDPISPADCLKDKTKAPDCQRLGLLYVDGQDVPRDEPRAIGFLDAACRAGLASSCGVQGWLLLKRHERPEDATQGAQLLERVCKDGGLGACDTLGQAYGNGIGVARDVTKAAKLLEKACEGDTPQSCVTLAMLLDAGDGVPIDADRAKALMSRACAVAPLPVCEQACDTGNGNACVALGDRLARETEPGRADRAFQLACNAAAVEGCFRLASRTVDPEQAVSLFERACSLDYVPGCVAAGHSYYLGRGAKIDLVKAAGLYEKACDKESSAACRALGGLYARGELGSEDAARGRAYLVKACGEDVECRAILANGRIPSAWGGSLSALRPRETVTHAEGPLRLGGKIQAPRKIRDASPVYPAQARTARIQGTVTLECVISPRGDVTDVRVVNSIPMLDAAAVAAVRQWRYTSAILDGMPVPVIMTMTVRFKIS